MVKLLEKRSLVITPMYESAFYFTKYHKKEAIIQASFFDIILISSP